MIEKILERLEEKRTKAEDEMHRLRDGDYALPCSFDRTDIEEVICGSFADAIEIVQEVAKEYEEKVCCRCKHCLVNETLEPCKYCMHLKKHIYNEDNFEPMDDAPYQKGE